MGKNQYAKWLANSAVESLVDEVSLTPKPGLVDQADNGSHKDLTYSMMMNSAISLEETFYKMAILSMEQQPSQTLREKFGEVGREGERQMYMLTNGVNTHKGAIWTLGLLVASAAINYNKPFTTEKILETVSTVASIEDRYVPDVSTNGKKAISKYGGTGAKQEAQNGLPHVRDYSLPLYMKKLMTNDEKQAKYAALLILMGTLNDTCILHRGGKEGLQYVQNCARNLLERQAITEKELNDLNESFIKKNLSPGGSADLFAATLFLHKLVLQHSKPQLQLMNR